MSLHIIVDSDGSLERLIAALTLTLKQGAKQMAAIDNLTTAVADLTAAVTSAAGDLAALSQALNAAIASGDQGAVTQAAADIETQVANLNAAVGANQPPAPAPGP